MPAPGGLHSLVLGGGLLPGGCLVPGGAWSGGSAPGGCLVQGGRVPGLGGGLLLGGVPAPGGCLVETPPGRPLLRAVRILLECILVLTKVLPKPA